MTMTASMGSALIQTGGGSAAWKASIVQTGRVGIMRYVSGGVRTERDRLPNVLQEVKVKAQVVEGPEHRRRELAGARQVVQEGPRYPPRARAGRASALRIDRPRVVLVAGVPDLEHPLAGEQDAVPRVARRQHAVEEVHPLPVGVQDVLRIAD